MTARRARKQVNYSELDNDAFDSDEEIVHPAPKRKRLDTSPPPDEDALQAAIKKAAEEHREKVLMRVEEDTPKQDNATKPKSTYDPSKAGFMSLPAELRLKIYDLLLLRTDCVDFGRRKNFAHSAQLLSVNRKVNEEGSAVLYGSTKFIFRPCRSAVGEFFEEQWSWIGWGGVKRFLTTIGPRNLGFLKTIGFDFVDATPTDEPKLGTEDRRFHHSKDLRVCLRQLALHATGLEMLRLGFSGRSRFHRSSSTEPLSEILELIVADVVVIGPTYRTRSSGEEERWLINSSDRTSFYFENKIFEIDRLKFIRTMTRSEPLYPKLVEKHQQHIEKAKELFEADEKDRYEWFSRI